MDALPRNGSGDGAVPDSPSGILDAYARIHCICLAAGVPSIDADDLAQDVFLWLLRNGPLLALPAMPFLAAVVRNYIKRYRREKGCRIRVEGVPLDETAEPSSLDSTEDLEKKEILDTVAAALPATERTLLALIRSGLSLAQASNSLGIPKGSRDYYQGRLVTRARRELRSCRSQIDAGSASPGAAHFGRANRA